MLSDSELLCAAQAPDASRAIRDQFGARFRGFLVYVAGRYCRLYKLSLDHLNDVADAAILMVIDGKHVTYKPGSERSVRGYLAGLVMNAAKAQARFNNSGSDLQHDWADPCNPKLHLPLTPEEIADDHGDCTLTLESRELVEQAFEVARPAELLLIARHFYAGESFDEIAKSIGVARTTISRRMERFYDRAAAVMKA